MNPILRQAITKADEIREQIRLDIYKPLNIMDTCVQLGLTVRILDINMEGMYFKQDDKSFPEIILSNQRPLPRRCFTCAHELGHHVFGHGSKIDGLTNDADQMTSDSTEEFLVNCFAGALLMPIAGIYAEFAKRKWQPQTVNAIEFYTIASIFGTGYQTLITHCKANNIISDSKADALRKLIPSQILKQMMNLPDETSYFKIIDHITDLSLIDLEELNYIIFPKKIKIEGNHLQFVKSTQFGFAYKAVKPGILRVSTEDNSSAHIIRIQRHKYFGLAENRHLENELE